MYSYYQPYRYAVLDRKGKFSQSLSLLMVLYIQVRVNSRTSILHLTMETSHLSLVMSLQLDSSLIALSCVTLSQMECSVVALVNPQSLNISSVFEMIFKDRLNNHLMSDLLQFSLASSFPSDLSL